MIDPRPGATRIGRAGVDVPVGAVRAGYTLFFTVSGLLALPSSMKVPLDTVTDFKPIAMVGISTALLGVPPQSPAGHGIAWEFVAHARKKTPASSTTSQLGQRHERASAALSSSRSGTALDITSISYEGLPPGVQDLLANRLDLAMVSTTLW